MEMQNFDLRQAIVDRVQKNSKEDFLETISGSIDGDERTLPGLGVLFEIIWKESQKDDQEAMIDTLFQHFQHDQPHPSSSPSY